MNNTSRWSTLILFITVAVVLYFLGFTSGAVVFIILGALFEIAFWVRLFRKHDVE